LGCGDGLNGLDDDGAGIRAALVVECAAGARECTLRIDRADLIGQSGTFLPDPIRIDRAALRLGCQRDDVIAPGAADDSSTADTTLDPRQLGGAAGGGAGASGTDEMCLTGWLVTDEE
jgi:hypothetical protein